MPDTITPPGSGSVANHIASYWKGIFRKEVQIQGQPYTYLEAGTGPTILLVHGFFGAKNHWRSVMMGLKKYFHVVAVEVPGFNLAQWLPGQKHTLRCLSNWLETFTQAIHLQTFHVVGFSAGACLGAYFAHQYPQKVLSLSFISFPNIYFEEERLYKNSFDECLYKQVQCAQDVEGVWASIFYEPPQVPHFFHALTYQVVKYRLPALVKLLQELSDGTSILLPRLRLIECPVLALRGEFDSYSSAEMAAYLQRTVPNVQLQEIKAAKHLCYVERYAETVTLLLRFLGGVRPQAFDSKPSALLQSTS